ncbi:MAG: hypothetical protein KJ692_14445, partial [Verrucomicrobia bacterium]|nr:hypothetical protein [Verrucomicrobiota bacterium]
SRVAPVSVFTFTHWPYTMLPWFHFFHSFLNPRDHITDTDFTDGEARVTRVNLFHISDIRAIRGKILVFYSGS